MLLSSLPETYPLLGLLGREVHIAYLYMSFIFHVPNHLLILGIKKATYSHKISLESYQNLPPFSGPNADYVGAEKLGAKDKGNRKMKRATWKD